MIDWKKHPKATRAIVNYLNDDNKSHVAKETFTRPTQKTVADAVEQESEKWTHAFDGRKCRVVFTEDYRSWVKGEGLDRLVSTGSLKPIKPTIKPSAAWSLVSEQGWSVYEVNEKYEVVGKD